MKKNILWIIAVLYFFIAPLYYYHMKETKIKHGCPWDREYRTMGIMISAVWPFGLMVETYIALDEGWKKTH